METYMNYKELYELEKSRRIAAENLIKARKYYNHQTYEGLDALNKALKEYEQSVKAMEKGK